MFISLLESLQALDRHQSWSWVIEHRLPLFLKSDVFSEYKLCKLLCSKDNTITADKLPPFKSNSSTKLITSSPVKKQSTDGKMSDSSLPSIVKTSSSNLIVENMSTTSLQSSSPRTTVVNSIELVKTSSNKVVRQRSRSVDLSTTPLDLSYDDIKLIDSKSGMSALWKFLRGKAGEKNWLFWLDAERVTYHTNPLDQQRYNTIIIT